MKSESSLIVAPVLNLAQGWCNLSPDAAAQKESALESSALIGKVHNRDENNAAGAALARLQSLSRSLESQRKKITDPFVDAQRMVKRMVDEFKDDLEREAARVELLMKDFAMEEQRRIREEQEAQQREIQRIENERLAEQKRIADEQARIEREAREAREAAERAAREATNKAQREAAAKAFAESEILRKEAEKKAAIAAEEKRIADEKATLDSRFASAPIETTRAAGQTTRKKWKITQINDAQLYKAMPWLVRKIEWDMLQLTQALNDSCGKLPGVTAEEDLKISVRQSPQRAAIDV